MFTALVELVFLTIASFCQCLSAYVCFLLGFTGEDTHVESDFSMSTLLVSTSAIIGQLYLCLHRKTSQKDKPSLGTLSCCVL